MGPGHLKQQPNRCPGAYRRRGGDLFSSPRVPRLAWFTARPGNVDAREALRLQESGHQPGDAFHHIESDGDSATVSRDGSDFTDGLRDDFGSISIP